ncbi:MAG TPA: hypothetical protein VFJ16_16535 [Longimicrobium sp.]|nr:hypothetical protein [Longimicrobium sp.]
MADLVRRQLELLGEDAEREGRLREGLAREGGERDGDGPQRQAARKVWGSARSK